MQRVKRFAESRFGWALAMAFVLGGIAIGALSPHGFVQPGYAEMSGICPEESCEEGYECCDGECTEIP